MTRVEAPVEPRSSFLATLGRLPGTWIALAVTVTAGLCEGLGLTLFIPLLETLDDGGKELGTASTILKTVLDTVHLPMNLFTMLAMIVVLVGGSFAIVFAKDRMLERARHGHMEALRKALGESLFLSRWHHLSGQSSGDVVNKLLIECHRSAAGLILQVMVVATIVHIAIFVVISSLLSWRLLALTIALAALVGWLIRPLHGQSRHIGDAIIKANRNYGVHIVDYLKGARLIRVTGSETRVLERLQGLNRTAVKTSLSSEVIRVFTFFLVQTLAVAILAGIIAVSRQGLDIPTSVLFTFLIIMARMVPRLIQLQQYYQGYVGYAATLPVVDAAIAAARDQAEDRGAGGEPFGALTGGVELHEVTFRYDTETKGAVSAVSLRIPRNNTIAIVGGSGAGKSSVIDLIAGLQIPQAGRITIDGIDLRRMDLLSWRKRIGYVTQDVIIFNDTVRNNLVFAHPEATAADIGEVLELTRLGDVIEELPDGLDTVLGEGGVRLSGGQKQRLALARALIGDPQLLLLDEATSALDNESEHLIQKALGSIAHRLTIVVVAHRLATVRKADTIFVMERGRIVESGSFDALVAGKGRFSELHESQFS
jgi:ATP-binding cassette, subfamily B, bacterial MsbA